MKRLAALLCGFWAVLAAAAAPSEAQAEKRVALVIGNSAYQNASRLTNPGNDASAMADLFRRAGFDVVEARQDLGNLEFKRVAREFTVAARDADVAVMYFAGHGIEVNGTNYLIPIDARLATDFDVEDEALSLDRLVRALEPARRLRLIILDACRDNPFIQTMQRSVASRAVSSGLAKVEPATSDTLVAFAAKAGSTADDGRGPNSPFTTALLNHLTVPGRDVRIALGYVRDEVIKTTGNKQEPFVYGSLGGATVALVPEPKREIAAQPSLPAPQPNIAAPSGSDPRRDYEFAERVGTKEAWDSFLSVHKSGFYADLARAQRDKLAARSQSQTFDSKIPAVPPVPNVAVIPPSVAPASPSPEQKVAVLPPSDAAKPTVEARPDIRVLTRDLQTELKRVGCDPGALDGNWSPKSVQALNQFNRRAGMKLDVKVATLGALDAVKGQKGRICPLICGRGERVEGDQCVAIPAEPKPVKREAARPPEPSPRERLRERVRERAQERIREQRQLSTRPEPRRTCSEGSPLTVGGRACCEVTPERGAARIFCP
ncbi:caspase family protein [Pseudorhodoplanes sinuspersici]|uniref:Uncharacterized protein n=1 Tax=Pseudorhodoplanes sinuspersici TaxID=1235591 RepID=A0A1W6ZKU9_9HYPH|nr:caspase family protein [Pseudorhodoplanes sinuspersici]ARP97750.1 hypothetical protein CAK95_00645 [Pseudorhodoplanes sinuspersici]RKE68526.1 putative caspase-like protein [Pseudorhodoplanes sinuspersici]